VLSAVTTFSACLRRSIWYVAVCYLRVCVPDVPVCGMFGCELHNQTFQRQVHQARTHIDNITATYQINNLTTQTSREGSNSTKHERRLPEDGQTVVTETCRVLMMCFTNILTI